VFYHTAYANRIGVAKVDDSGNIDNASTADLEVNNLYT
jgi:hypothetical protein